VPSPRWYPPVKRLGDVLTGLVLLGPALAVLTVAALASLLLHGRPVFFVQLRVGRNGRPFRLVKLRTMTGPPGAGRAYRERGRLTACGRIMRPLRIDELPQLLHLIAGTMSLVGPRPLLAEHVSQAGGGGRRHEVRPGLTCFAQLELAEHGYLDRYRQVSLDDEYVARLSLRTDLAILWRTAGALLGRRCAAPLARFEPHGAGRPAGHPAAGESGAGEPVGPAAPAPLRPPAPPG
jgi:lipopolysaccharide/colanic/teichoic acid biosynthesis glycosyltransferase